MFSLSTPISYNNLVPIGSAIICTCSPTDICEQWERNFLLRPADVHGEGTHDAHLRMSAEEARHVLKSWYTGGSPEQGFWRCFADGLNQSLVIITKLCATDKLFVCGTG